MALADSMYSGVRLLPGRLRAPVPGLRGNRRYAAQLEALLGRIPGIRFVKANPDTGRVLVYYSPNRLTAAALLLLLARGVTSGRSASAPRLAAAQVAVTLESSMPRAGRGIAGASDAVSELWPCGLSSEEARRRLAIHGPNALQEAQRTSFFKRLLEQFKDIMMVTLLAGAGISLVAGRMRDFATITGVLVINSIIGAAQTGKAEGAVAALHRVAAPRARVLRDGCPVSIAPTAIVPGDVLLLEPGDRIPADGLVLQAVSAECDESLLTGESTAMEKHPAQAGPLPDRGIGRVDMVYAGTTLTRGRCLARVTATGMRTEMGHIAALLGQVKESPTPLQERMRRLGQALVAGSLAISGTVVAIGLLRGQPPVEMLLAGISLAVAAIPEGLPTFITLGLATGVHQMARKKALVRRLQAVETLGCATAICTDKTGTLTRNQMALRKVYTGGRWYSASDPDFAREPDVQQLLTIGALCNNASLEQAQQAVHGDATESALLMAAAESGIDLSKGACRLAEVPFDSIRRRMTVVLAGVNGPTAYAKGAPEAILMACSQMIYRGKVIPLTAADRQQVLLAAEHMAREAYRVLGAAYRPVSDAAAEDPEQDLIFAGLVGLMDPPRPEVPAAIARCHRAGIRVIMLTGDHPLTAAAVAREIGLMRPGDLVLTGDELFRMDDAALQRNIPRLRVCARVSPEQKLRVVRILKELGHVVAMTGDGVNDAPAVKMADIGVAMGRSGTEVTKEAASLVLADDNFATIVAAVEQGRITYNNIRKAIRYLIASNIGEMVVITSAMVIGLPAPLLPLQLLWLNFVGDSLPALALVAEPAGGREMTRMPRPREESIFAGGLGPQIVGHGLQMGLAGLGLFVLALRAGKSLPVVQTMTLSSLVAGQLLYLWRCRQGPDDTPGQPKPNPYVTWAAVGSLALLVGSVTWGPVRRTLQLVPLTAGEWVAVGAGAAVGAL